MSEFGEEVMYFMQNLDGLRAEISEDGDIVLTDVNADFITLTFDDCEAFKDYVERQKVLRGGSSGIRD